MEGMSERIAALEEQTRKIKEELVQSSFMMMAMLSNINDLIELYQRQSTRPICILQYLEASSPPCQTLNTVPTMQVATKLGSRKKQELIQQKTVPVKMKCEKAFRHCTKGQGGSKRGTCVQPAGVGHDA